MESSITILIIINLILGPVCAIPLSKFIRHIDNARKNVSRYFIILLCIYIIECVLLTLAMGIPIPNIALAFVWGFTLGLRFKKKLNGSAIRRISLYVSLYTSLPAATFIIVPFLALCEGWSILSLEDGIKFGIPAEIPGPLGSILGFYVALVSGTVLLKALFTIRTARAFARQGK